MKKILALTAIVALMAFSVLPSRVFATGPSPTGQTFINADGQIVPYAPNTGMAGLLIAPLGATEWLQRIGTETNIQEDNITIYISPIPEATYNATTGEWEGTYVMDKISLDWPYGWLSLKFWLNGAGTVTIRYEDADENSVETVTVTEYIFFKVVYVGGGEGNSDFDAGHNYDVIIKAYK